MSAKTTSPRFAECQISEVVLKAIKEPAYLQVTGGRMANKRGEGTESSASTTTTIRFGYFFAPRIASLAALATRNLTTRLAAILMVSPVAGFRPMRALRFTSTILPSPGIVKEFLAFLYASATRASKKDRKST